MGFAIFSLVGYDVLTKICNITETIQYLDH